MADSSGNGAHTGGEGASSRAGGGAAPAGGGVEDARRAGQRPSSDGAVNALGLPDGIPTLIFICFCVNTYVYICIYIYIQICMCVCIYIHTYITMLRTESVCRRQMVTMYTLMCALGHSIPRALCARSDQIVETVTEDTGYLPN